MVEMKRRSLAIGGHRAEYRGTLWLVRCAPQSLDGDIGPPARLEKEMDPPLIRRPTAQISMVGPSGATGIREDKDRLLTVHESLRLGKIGASTATFELLATITADNDAARSPGDFGDFRRAEMGDQRIERGRYGRHGAEFLDQRVAPGDGLGALHHIAGLIAHRL
jgi:hypothetical protein